MGRPIGTFAERQAAKQRRDALAGITTTEHLLALILIELRETRGHQLTADHAAMLERVGFSRAQVAAILDSSPASLHVLKRRRDRGDAAPSADVEAGAESAEGPGVAVK